MLLLSWLYVLVATAYVVSNSDHVSIYIKMNFCLCSVNSYKVAILVQSIIVTALLE